MAGIYIHIPFCVQKCNYCDFFSSASSLHKEAILGAILDEMKRRRGYLKGDLLSTIYIGGGTPTVYSARELARLLANIGEVWSLNGLEEVTVEANPDDLSESYLAELRSIGVNRLSIGVQSLNDEVLRFMNRRHDSKVAIEAVKRAQRAGFDNITIDLMYGVPGLTTETWSDTIDRGVGLDVQHISAYHLTVESDTVFGKMLEDGDLQLVDDEIGCEQYSILHEKMENSGYEHYEVSNFAKQGFRARHNSSYWSGERYLGIGPAAHSFDGDSRAWNVSSLEGYLKGYANGFALESEVLTAEDRRNEYVMTRLRCKDGIDFTDYERRFGAVYGQRIRLKARKESLNSALEVDDEGCRIPSKHFLMSDNIIRNIFE